MQITTDLNKTLGEKMMLPEKQDSQHVTQVQHKQGTVTVILSWTCTGFYSIHFHPQAEKDRREGQRRKLIPGHPHRSLRLRRYTE